MKEDFSRENAKWKFVAGQWVRRTSDGRAVLAQTVETQPWAVAVLESDCGQRLTQSPSLPTSKSPGRWPSDAGMRGRLPKVLRTTGSASRGSAREALGGRRRDAHAQDAGIARGLPFSTV